MAGFQAKRQVDSQSLGKEMKRVAAHGAGKVAGVPADVATANATDLATVIALANQLKTTLNLLLANSR
jgi:hypothetical protein